jgi:putative membrane protein
MKHLSRLIALAGLAAAVWLVIESHPQAAFDAMRAAGGGLLIAAFAHLLTMPLNARAWQILIRAGRRPSLLRMVHCVWLRESVNNLLPVARIGGELVSFRMLRHAGMRSAPAAASIVADMQLNLISQLVFTMVGIGFLFGHADSGSLRLASDLAWGVAVLAPVFVLFALVQHARPFERMSRVVNRLTSGKLAQLIGPSARVDLSLQLIWRRRDVILRYLFIWQPAQRLATSLEIWLALHFLGVPASFWEAIVIESLIGAINSAAFFVPGGLGVQEGGFMLIGGALGLDPSTCLALAGARRIRDLVMYLPGLVAWQLAESSGRRDDSAALPHAAGSL